MLLEMVWKFVPFVVLSLHIFFAGCIAAQNAGLVKRPDVVNIGALVAYDSTIGKVSRKAIELAVEDVNRNLSVLNGIQLVVTMMDTNCSAFFGKVVVLVKRPDVVNIGALVAYDSTIGKVARKAIELVVEDVNSNLSVLNGIWLVVTMMDTNCSAFFGTIVDDADALPLFCFWAFGQKSIPSNADNQLVKQVQVECKGLPLALKVIGSSLYGQPHPAWEGAKNKLLKGESISDYHKEGLRCLETSIDALDEEARECFLDLGSFPEDRKISLDALLDIWIYVRKME